MTDLGRRVKRILLTPWTASSLALLGGAVFAIELLFLAHYQTSVLDEGLYLYKGFLFASGRYEPFQDYGPLTNHMPLAFLIPGTVQVWLGPGLRIGRYFAIILALVMLFSLWLTARRMTNRWLAAGAVWAVTLNPMTARLYSQAISEGLVASLLMASIALTLGEKRPIWQVAGGAFLAGVIAMTRVNLLPVLPLLLVYILWQHGWKAARWGVAAGLLPIAAVHVIYWPNVLRLWAFWLPEAITPFLSSWRPPAEAVASWEPVMAADARLNSFLDGFRFHFVALAGTLAAWLMWPRRESWKKHAQFKAAIYLSVLLVILILMHGWASLANNYCVYCFPIYLGFFSGLGLLLAVIVLPFWRQISSRVWQFIAGAIVLILCSGIGFSAASEVNRVLLPPFYARDLIYGLVPRIQSMQILPGEVPMWVILENKFGLTFETTYRLIWILPGTLLGFVAGVLVLAGAQVLKAYKGINPTGALPASRNALVIFLGLGMVLSPSWILSGGFRTYDCPGDNLAAYEAVGSHLAQVVPAEASVYWKGGLSPAPLLYLPEAQIFPPQLNGDYSFRLGGESDALQRYGWWDQNLANQWLAEADFVLVEARFYTGWLADALASGPYQELPPTPLTSPCRPDSAIRIFKNVP